MNKLASTILTRYLIGSCAYGFVRKIDDVVNARILIREYDEKTREHFDRPVPMLLTDRIMVLGLSTLASPYLLPMYIYNDLSQLEVRMRGANPDDYGYGSPKRYVFSYLF